MGCQFTLPFRAEDARGLSRTVRLSPRPQSTELASLVMVSGELEGLIRVNSGGSRAGKRVSVLPGSGRLRLAERASDLGMSARERIPVVPGDGRLGPRFANRRHSLAVIGSGFGRTGTASLKRALESLGFESAVPGDCRSRPQGATPYPETASVHPNLAWTKR